MSNHQLEAKHVMEQEAAAILKTSERLTEDFGAVVDLLLHHRGKIICCGIGKSGFIAQKIAATLTSTGTQTVFLHPTEALHGDLGIYTPGDPTILLSRSGSTKELLTLIPILKHFSSPLIGIIGNLQSPLAKACDYYIEAYVDQEADPLALVPTTSAITALAVGDALASALIKSRGFRREDFAQFHPGGQLGRNLLLKVSDVMQKLERIAIGAVHTPVRQIAIAMTEKPVGACCITDGAGRLLGIITEGDIRRLFQRTETFHGICAEEIMTKNPRTILASQRLGEAIEMMEGRQSPVYVLPVVDGDNHIQGLLRLHDAYDSGHA